MIFDQDRFDQAKVAYSRFDGEDSTEFNLMITPEAGTTFPVQLASIEKALRLFLRQQELTDEAVVFKRYFLSDYSNQSEIQERLAASRYQSAVSVVQQTPLNGAKVILLVTLLDGANTQKFRDENTLIFSHNGYSHVFSTQLHSKNSQQNSFDQTTDIFQNYLETLEKQNIQLAENCIRTWIYVRDIDNNYAGMVKARNEVFDQHQLTKDSHFIASTGIEGRYSNPSVSVLMDAYSVGGIRPEQVKFLKALSHLTRPTSTAWLLNAERRWITATVAIFSSQELRVLITTAKSFVWATFMGKSGGHSKISRLCWPMPMPAWKTSRT